MSETVYYQIFFFFQTKLQLFNLAYKGDYRRMRERVVKFLFRRQAATSFGK